MSKMLSDTGSSTSVDDVFSLLDTDSDGNITKSEMQAAQTKLQQQMQLMQSLGGMSGAMPPPPPPDSSSLSNSDEDTFSKLDTNGDGKIDSTELSAMLANGPKSSLSADQVMSLADSNGDGSISESEFTSTKDKVHEAMLSGTSQSSSSSSGDSLITSLLDALKSSSSSGTSATSDTDTTAAQRLTQLLQNIISSYSQSNGAGSKAATNNTFLSSGIYA
jgi:Ca2+-binding EF-hand superfamily protein